MLQITELKGLVQPKQNKKRKCTPPQAIQNGDEFVSSLEQFCRPVALHHFLTNGCSAVNRCRQYESPKS